MSKKQDKLNALRTQSKEIAAEKKKLKEELDKTKEERKRLVSSIAANKKKMREANTKLRIHIGKCNSTVKEKDIANIDILANSIEQTSADIVKCLRAIAEDLKTLDTL